MGIKWHEVRDFMVVCGIDVQDVEDHLEITRGMLSRMVNFDPLGRPSPERWAQLRDAILTLKERQDNQRAEEAERILAIASHWR